MVRSTIAAVAYSVSEAVEEAQWPQSVLAELIVALCSVLSSMLSENIQSLPSSQI